MTHINIAAARTMTLRMPGSWVLMRMPYRAER